MKTPAPRRPFIARAAAVVAVLVAVAATPEGFAQEPIGDPTPARLSDVAEKVARVSEKEIEATIRALAGFGTRHTMSETESRTRGIGAARRFIREKLEGVAAESEGRLRVETRAYVHEPDGRRISKPTEIVDVLAIVEGTDPDRVVVVSGHYDSIPKNVMDFESDAPGANDDASGTAVAMESARVLVDARPRATLLFAAVSGEEQSLLGSAFLAKSLKDANKSVVFMATADIVGGSVGSNGRREPNVLRCFSEGIPSGPKDARGRVLRTIEGSDNDAPSRQAARYFAARAPLYVPGFEVRLVFRQDRYLRGGDHRSFNDLGFAAFRLTEPNENYDRQHQDVVERDGRRFGDRPEDVDFSYVAKVARCVVAAAYEAAAAPASPKQVRVDVRALTPDTTLRWEANSEADLRGYAVLHRRTHEPTWTGRVEVPKDKTEVVLQGFSKDDWLFAVEAVDAAGRRSPPVYPTPQMR
jgi:hypothetical protein